MTPSSGEENKSEQEIKQYHKDEEPLKWLIIQWSIIHSYPFDTWRSEKFPRLTEQHIIVYKLFNLIWMLNRKALSVLVDLFPHSIR